MSVRGRVKAGLKMNTGISIQLLVSVREALSDTAKASDEHFNTTACVGSRPLPSLSKPVISKFQYNCLCRFEATNPARGLTAIDFNTTACVGSRNCVTTNPAGNVEFQYNCLCRFELREVFAAPRPFVISIQLLVSVRALVTACPCATEINFNTTACVGSS